MKQLSILFTLLAFGYAASAQNVGVNTSSPDPSAALHVNGSDKGFLAPSVTLTGTNDVSTVTDAPYPSGLVVYNTATVGGANGVNPGFYYWDGSKWQRLVTAEEPDTDWAKTGGGIPTITDEIYHSGNVGIGTTDPTKKLDVNGAMLLRGGTSTVDFSGAQQLFGYAGTNQYKHGIKTRHHSGQASTNAIDFYVWNHGVDADADDPTKLVMTLDGNGSGMVGIGTPYPETKLHIKTDNGSGGGHLRIQRETTDGEVGISMLPKFASATNAWYMTVGGWGNTDDWVLGGGGSSNVIVAENTTGDVGINISDPSQKLHVDGNVKIGNNTTDRRTLFFGDGSYVYLEETLDDYLTIEASNGLRLGNDGNYFKGLYHGTFTVGDNDATQCGSCAWSAWNGDFLEIQVNWSTLGVPSGSNKTVFLYCDAGNNTYTDHFMASVQQVNSSRFDAFVRRVDSWDSGWGLTTLKIHYLVLQH